MELAGDHAADRKVVVLVPPEVPGSPGDTIKLPCNLQPVESEIPRVKQIRWKRLEPLGDPSTLAEFDWTRGPKILALGVQFVAARKGLDLDQSLTLTDLRPDDDANYTCEVTTFQHGSGRASTWLRVFYAPQVSITLYDVIGQQGYRETNLSCEAHGNPEPRSYNWSTTTGSLPSCAVPQGTWLLLQPSEETINITFICCVSNTLGTAQANMSIQLPGPSKDQSRSHLAILIILIIMVLGVLGILAFQKVPSVFSLKCLREV